MIQLICYYKKGVPPLQNLMSLDDQEIISFMQEQFPNDTMFHKNPRKYIHDRRATEHWLYEQFRGKGGTPRVKQPIYFTYGRSSYIENLDDYNEHLKIPLDDLDQAEVSFTYPDSMVSKWLSDTKKAGYYNPNYHGKVFTLPYLKLRHW